MTEQLRYKLQDTNVGFAEMMSSRDKLIDENKELKAENEKAKSAWRLNCILDKKGNNVKWHLWPLLIVLLILPRFIGDFIGWLLDLCFEEREV